LYINLGRDEAQIYDWPLTPEKPDRKDPEAGEWEPPGGTPSPQHNTRVAWDANPKTENPSLHCAGAGTWRNPRLRSSNKALDQEQIRNVAAALLDEAARPSSPRLSLPQY